MEGSSGLLLLPIQLNFKLLFWGKRTLRKFKTLIKINCEYLEFCLKNVIKNE